MGVWRFPVSAPTPTSYTRPDPAKKAAKPYKDFPLFLHQTGEYAKKVRGRMHYSGVKRSSAREVAQGEGPPARGLDATKGH